MSVSRAHLVALCACGALGCSVVLGFPERVEDPGASDAAVDSASEGGVADGAPDTFLADGRETGSDAGCGDACPVAAYTFDEASGATAVDVSGHGNTANLAGASWAAGKYAGGVHFAGTNDSLVVAASPSIDISGTAISILFWLNLVDNQAHDHVILSKAYTAGTMTEPYYQYGIEFNHTAKTLDLFFAVGPTAAGRRGPLSFRAPIGRWAHIAFTYDGALVKGYVDGLELLSTPVTGSIQARGTQLKMGVDAANGQGLSGTLDALRIYDRTLAPAEIQAVMASP